MLDTSRAVIVGIFSKISISENWRELGTKFYPLKSMQKNNVSGISFVKVVNFEKIQTFWTFHNYCIRHSDEQKFWDHDQSSAKISSFQKQLVSLQQKFGGGRGEA